MTILASTPATISPLRKAESGDGPPHKKLPYQAPTLVILDLNIHTAGSIYGLQESDAGNGNGAAS